MQIASLFAAIGADTSRFEKALRTVDSQLNKHSKNLSGWQGAVTKGFAAVGLAAAGVAAGMTAAVTKFTKNAAEMEQSVADIAAVWNLTRDEMGKVDRLINDLNLDPRLKVNAKGASDTIEMLAKNGLTLDQVMAGAARSTVLLSNATGGDFAMSADLATDVMAIFKIRAEEMERAVNGIVGTTQASKFSINDYALALAQGGGVAASVGVSFEDFNATIAAISPLFASGSDAGTSFKTFLQRLIPQSDKAAELMKRLGLMTEDGANRFFDATGQMKSMTEVAKLMQLAFAGLSEEQKNEAASTIFGTDAMRAAFALAEAGGDTIERFKQQIGAANAEAAAATRMNTFAGSWEKMQDIIEATGVSIGKKFLPVARRVVDWIASSVERSGPGLESIFGNIATWLDSAITSAGAFARGISGWFMPAIKGVFSFLSNIPSAYRKFREIVDNVSDPGLVRMVNGLRSSFQGLGKILGNLARPFKDAFGGLFQSLMVARGGGWANIFDVLVTRMMTAVSRFGDVLNTEAVPFVLTKLGELGTAVGRWIDEVDWWGKIEGWAAKFAGWAAKIWDDGQGGGVKFWLGKFWTWLTGWVVDPEKRTQLLNAISNTWTSFVDWAGKVWDTVSPVLDDLWTSLTSWVTVPEKRQQLLDALQGAWTSFTDWAAWLWSVVEPALGSLWTSLTSWVTVPEKRQQLLDALQGAWTSFTEWAGLVWDAVSPVLGDMWTSLTSWVTVPEKRQQLFDALSKAWTSFTEWAGKVWEWAEPKLSQFWDDLTSWITDPMKRSQLFSKLETAWTSFTDWAGSLWSWVQPKLDDLWISLTSWVTNPVKRTELFDAIADAWTSFTEWASGIWNGTSENPGGVKAKLDDFGGNIKTWIDENTPSLGSWIDAFLDFAKGAAEQWNISFPAMSQNIADLRSKLETEVPLIGKAFQDLWAVIFGGDGGAESTGSGIMRAMEALVSTTTRAIGTLVTQLRLFIEILGLSIQMYKAFVSGDFDAAIQFGREAGGKWFEFGEITGQQWNFFTDQLGNVFNGGGGSNNNTPEGGNPSPTPSAAREPSFIPPYEGVTAESDGVLWVWRNGRWERVDGRQHGGRSTFGGLTWVGEKGPELVNLPAGSYVHTAAQSQAIMAQGGSQRIDLYVHGDSNLPQDRGKLRELAIALQRELQLSGATTTRLALA